MRCQLCRQKAKALTFVKRYGAGVKVCSACYQEYDKHRHQPYSKVMDRLAMAETGYHANRKRK